MLRGIKCLQDACGGVSYDVNIKELREFLAKTDKINENEIKRTFWKFNWENSEVKELLLTHPKTAQVVQKSIEKNRLRKLGNQLVQAADRNDVKHVRSLLDANIAIDHQNYDDYGYNGATALIAAARNHNVEMMRFLITSNADIEIKPHNGNGTALNQCMYNFYYYDWDQIEKISRLVDSIHFLLEHHARIDDSIKLYRILYGAYKCHSEESKIINCLKHLCKQLEDRGIQAAEKPTLWHSLNHHTTENDAEVLREAKLLLVKVEKAKRQREEKNHKSTHHHSFLHSMNPRTRKKEEVLDDTFKRINREFS